MHLRSDLIDTPVTKRVLEVIKPKQIETAVRALEEIVRREEAVDNQWRMQIERAEYEAILAQRRYEAVDPGNRLVAGTLEKKWNEALVKLEEVRCKLEEHKQKNRISATEDQKSQLLELAQNLPKLWKARTTSAKDRKRILRLIIKDITVEKTIDPKQIVLHIRWQGGAIEDIPVEIPANYPDRIRYKDHIIARVRELSQRYADAQIVEFFNKEGLNGAKNKHFSISMIKWIRYKYGIVSPILKRLDELTINQVMDKFAVSRHVVYYWIERKSIAARRLNEGSPYWITIDAIKEKELTKLVKKSAKNKRQSDQHSKTMQ